MQFWICAFSAGLFAAMPCLSAGQQPAAAPPPELAVVANRPEPSLSTLGPEVVAEDKRQPKRILGFVPNYKAVSAGEIPLPPTPRRAFLIATKNNFDYSSYVFVGLLAAINEGYGAYPGLRKGLPGFWDYSWRGFLDKADGDYMTIFLMPTLLHEDGRYFAKGEGGKWRRTLYSTSRVFIAPSYQGRSTLNGAELLGKGVAQGLSTFYYPDSSRNARTIGEKYALNLARDAVTNTFREFWPDIAWRLRSLRRREP